MSSRSSYAPSRAAVRKVKRQANGNGHVDGAGSSDAYRRKLTAEASCKEADARRKQLQLRHMSAELVDRAAVTAAARKIVVTIKSRIESIPDELAMLLPPDIRPEAVHDLRESARMILVELAAMRHVDKAND